MRYAAAWPEKAVTIVDMAEDILGGRFSNELRAELRRQLEEIDVQLVLGSALREGEPPTAPGELSTFTVTTLSGRAITADIWFRCFGVTPVSDYLSGSLASARTTEGFIEVDPHLRVLGHQNVFALGDVSTADAKMAGFAGRQAAVVAVERDRCHLGIGRTPDLRIPGTGHRRHDRARRWGGPISRAGRCRRTRGGRPGKGPDDDGRSLRRDPRRSSPGVTGRRILPGTAHSARRIQIQEDLPGHRPVTEGSERVIDPL